jgi:hypothetical protein
MARIGGPPQDYGTTRRRSRRRLTALVVSDDWSTAGSVAVALARAGLTMRLALSFMEADELVEGVALIFAVVSEADPGILQMLKRWRGGRVIVGLAPDKETAEKLHTACDASLTPPWDIESVLGGVVS